MSRIADVWLPVPKRDEILKWLDPEDQRISQYKEHTRYREDRADYTGEDFLNGDFKEWASSNKKFLWLRGQGTFTQLRKKIIDIQNLIYPDCLDQMDHCTVQASTTIGRQMFKIVLNTRFILFCHFRL